MAQPILDVEVRVTLLLKSGLAQNGRNGAVTYEHILLDREDGVGIVTLNRPDVLNAMNRKLISARPR